MITPPSNSRFMNTQPVVVDGKETFGRYVTPSFLDDLTDQDIIYHKVTDVEAGRPDMIAYSLYGDPMLEWVIIMVNKPTNPLGFPRTGQTIMVVDRSVVLKSV